MLDEQNDSSRTNLVVWSGTTLEMQTHPSNCAGWNADIDAGSLSGLVGTTSALAIWSHSPDLGAPPCTAVNHVYCFEVP